MHIFMLYKDFKWSYFFDVNILKTLHDNIIDFVFMFSIFNLVSDLVV